MQNKQFLFEICANSVESCLAAQEGGANRVELCAGIPEGGTTPSYGEIKMARRLLNSTLLHVIIRPRGGDFLYSPLELERMITDIEICKDLGVDGVVFGCLQSDGTVDMEANAQLIKCAKGMNTTFHRAFDRCVYPQEALEQLIELGFNTVLTSGQQSTALEGTDLLKTLYQQANNRIHIMAGCGINENNIKAIYEATHIHEYHFSARTTKPSDMQYFNPNIYMGTKNADESHIQLTSAIRVRETIAALLQEDISTI